MADPKDLQAVEPVIEYVVNAAGAVNVAALDESLRAALGAAYAGLTLQEERVRVHLLSDIDGAQDTAAAVVAAHDAGTLTEVQQRIQDRADQIAALRKPWAEWSADDKDALLRLLAGDVVSLP
jgi:hypothetical protein